MTYVFPVMHYAPKVIRNIVVFYHIVAVFLEVVEDIGRDVVFVDDDVIVSVWPRLFVMKAQRVTHLVNYRAFLM